ncbi:MAG: DUF1330 domain-containing protein [Thaumarchaeota archaeon]|nr:DUF1330 domain-containing protein [Nitrososphaerota archaeon]
MKHYAVAQIVVTDPSWVRDYVANVTGIVERHGGKYLARTSQIQTFEGEQRTEEVIVLIEWPSKEIAEVFYESEEYRPYRQSREQGAENRFLLVAGEDVAKLAQMEGAGA